LRSELNSGDLLFRYKNDEFIAILRSSDAAAVSSFSARIKAKLGASTTSEQLPTTRLEVVVRHVNTTSDLNQLEDLLNQSSEAKTATRRFQIH